MAGPTIPPPTALFGEVVLFLNHCGCAGWSAHYCLWPCSLAVPVLAGWVYAFLWFYFQELPKAQPAVVLVLKRLRRRGNGLKSHPTDWEEPGIELATPGLQDIGLSPTPRRLLSWSAHLLCAKPRKTVFSHQVPYYVF